ncbi:MAG: tRNA-guanine transglycosylase DpdA [Pseudohaliea sp.]
MKRREKSLASSLRPAGELYSGLQHQRLMRGIGALQGHKKIEVDFWILSAGYGLVPASQKLAPYETTFAGMKKPELQSWANQLQVPRQFRDLVAQPYDLGVVLLGNDYLQACSLDDQIHLGGPTLFLTGKASAARMPRIRGARALVLSNAEAKRYRCGLVGLKGEIAARLLESIANNPDLAQQVADPGADVFHLCDDNGTTSASSPKAQPNPLVDKVIKLSKCWLEKPHRSKLRYFIPEWDDLVDPDFDFDTDTHSGGTGDWSNQVYAHQMYPTPNYDGILISKVVAEKSKKKKERINTLGVHRFLRVPRDFPVMGDCGAFGYIQDKNPPYTTPEIVDYYSRLNFDYGVSIDHLCVSGNRDEWGHRYQLTIENAADFIREHRSQNLHWTPIGAVQGWSPKTYAEAAAQMAKMGYEYLGLGGLVRSTTREINEIVYAVRQRVPEKVQIHVFGVARASAVPDFRELGVNSVDSAGALRQAWMRTAQSYLLDGEAYAAIRIPEAGKSFRAKHMEKSGLSGRQILELEHEALTAIRGFDAGTVSLDKCLAALLNYDRFVTSERADMEPLYRRVLKEQPWKKCGCAICQNAGVEVIIFRGNNRNRRRGFHNTYDFYRSFQKAVQHGRSDILDEMNLRQASLFDSEDEINAD